MKIERKNDNKIFKEIKNEVGTCFEYNGECYIITPFIIDEEFGERIIAFNLITNDFMFESEIDDNDLITILNLKLIEE